MCCWLVVVLLVVFGSLRGLPCWDHVGLDTQCETAMHLAASEGFSELCVMLYEHDPSLLHLGDSWNCTPIMRSSPRETARALARQTDRERENAHARA